MAISGTTAFNLDLSEIFEEAFERAGKELKSGYSIRTARRSLNLLMLEWASKQVNLWTIEELSIPLIANTATYTLPTGTIDIIEAVLRTSTGTAQSDNSLQRMGLSQYSGLSQKNVVGLPSQYYTSRKISPTVTMWPVPSVNNVYTLVYWRMRRVQDSGDTGQLTMDVPDRFLNPLIAGLAYYIAMKDPALTDRVDMLKSIYEEQWSIAIEEDRERVTMKVIPYISCM